MLRLDKPLDVILEFFDELGNVVSAEHTISDIIAHNGAYVFSTHQACINEIVNFRTADNQFEVSALVKTITTSKQGNQIFFRLMLEFAGEDWKSTWANVVPLETSELNFQEFLESSREVALLLQIVIDELDSGKKPDNIFLSELQTNVDNLRSILFLLRKI